MGLNVRNAINVGYMLSSTLCCGPTLIDDQQILSDKDNFLRFSLYNFLF